MKANKQNGSVVAIAAIVILIIGVLGYISWRVYDTNKTQNNQMQSVQRPAKDPNEGYVVIKEWGVRFKPVDGLTGIEYYPTPGTSDFFAFTTDALGKLDSNCSPATGRIILAGMTRSASADIGGNKYGPINGYYYYTKGSGAACSQSPYILETATKKQLLSSFDSLEAAK